MSNKSWWEVQLLDANGDFIDDTDNTTQIDVYDKGYSDDAHLRLSNHNANADGELVYKGNGLWGGDMDLADVEVYAGGVKQGELGGDSVNGLHHSSKAVTIHVNDSSIHRTETAVQTIVDNQAKSATLDQLEGTLTTLAGILTAINTAIGSIPSVEGLDQSDDITAINNKLGEMDFTGYDLIESVSNYTAVVKYLHNQIMTNYKAINKGTEIFNRRIIGCGSAIAGSAEGSIAAFFDFQEESTNFATKVIHSFVKRTGDKYCVANVCGAYANSSDDAVVIRLRISTLDTSDSLETYKDVEIASAEEGEGFKEGNIVVELGEMPEDVLLKTELQMRLGEGNGVSAVAYMSPVYLIEVAGA